MINIENYYTQEEVYRIVKDVEDLMEYLDGIDCVKVVNEIVYFEKEHVDRYLNR